MVKQFKCQGCGAFLEFDPRLQGLKCEYCGSVEAIEVEYKVAEEHDIFSVPKETGWDTVMATVQCESCGATISREKELAGECAFCNSPYVKELPATADIIRPETLIPFRIGDNTAKQIFRKWVGKGFFRPSNLKKLSRLAMIKGVYTPFWTYDCHANSSWTAQSGYYYYVSETYSTPKGMRTRQVQKVRWTPSAGTRDDMYDDVLIVASKGLDYDLVNKIYPFHLEQLVPYTPEFLSGWLAEEYAIDVKSGWGYAMQKVRASERDKCARVVPGDTHRALSVHTTFSNVTYKHVLLPVWVAAYQYKNKTYHFLVNGQTGEIQGYAPISWLKVGAVVAVITGIAAGLVYYLWSQGMI